MIKIELPFKTPSINHLFFHRNNMKILTTEARRIRKQIQVLMMSQVQNYDRLKNVPLKVDIDIYENWLTKKNLIKKKDVANREKFIVDSVFETLGIDDKFIVELKYRKIQDIKMEKAIVTIEKVEW